MTEIDYKSEIELSLATGMINEFIGQYLMSLSKVGLNEAMWQEMLDDAQAASDAGVSNQAEFTSYFYINHFIDDFVFDMLGAKLSEDELISLKKFVWDQRNDMSLTNLDSIKDIILQWIESHREKVSLSHPNIGNNYPVVVPYNLDKWKGLFDQIGQLIATGFKRSDAMERIAQQLNFSEKYDFLMWTKYHLDREYDKYNINEDIRKRNRDVRMHMALRDKIAADGQYYYLPRLSVEDDMAKQEIEPEYKTIMSDKAYSEQHAVDFEAARNKLMSRVFAIDKIIERYRKVLNQEQVDEIDSALTDLRKKVRKLKLASLKDSFIKTANIMKKISCMPIADELLSIAAEELPESVTEIVEKRAPSIPDDQREGTLDVVMNRLTDIGSVLKNRDVVRALSEIDLMLHKLRMASFFPEIQEAQSRLIDAFGYASNKIEDLLPKLRGGLTVQPEVVSKPDVKPPTTEQKQLGDEVKELSDGMKGLPKAPPPRPSVPVVEKPLEVVEDEVPVV